MTDDDRKRVEELRVSDRAQWSADVRMLLAALDAATKRAEDAERERDVWQRRQERMYAECNAEASRAACAEAEVERLRVQCAIHERAIDTWGEAMGRVCDALSVNGSGHASTIATRCVAGVERLRAAGDALHECRVFDEGAEREAYRRGQERMRERVLEVTGWRVDTLPIEDESEGG